MAGNPILQLLRIIVLFLREVLRAFLDLLKNLMALIELASDLIARLCRWAKLPDRLNRKTPFRCVPISDPAYKRPDPLLYAQYYLMAQGFAVTWDNPDIELRQNGVPVPSHKLAPDTEYEIVARVWNGSTEAPVVGLPVLFWYLNFGIGTKVNWIGDTKVNLGVKGGPNTPAFGSVKWRTPAAPGHYCIQVLLQWADDVNPNNNLGQENTDVGVAASPAVFSFALRNADTVRQAFRFEADAYALPPRQPCDAREPPSRDPKPLLQKPGTIARVPARHQRASHPLPPGWSIAFAPAAPLLAADEEIPVQVTIAPPDDFRGRQAINVHAFTSRGLAGGVTLTVER